MSNKESKETKDKRNMVLKIMLLGLKDVGTTIFRKKYLGKGFKQEYRGTIGTDFAVSRSILRINVDEKIVVLQIWDLASQRRFDFVREAFYKGALGCLLIFDPFVQKSFLDLEKWREELERNNEHKNIPILLIGYHNAKSEQSSSERVISKEEAENYAKQLTEGIGYKVPYIELFESDRVNLEKTIKKTLGDFVRIIFEYVFQKAKMKS